MKKLILSLLLASILLPSFAQSKIDFFDFVRDFDWNMSESDFRTKYKDRIVVVPDSMPDFYGKEGFIQLDNVYLDRYKTKTCVKYVELSQQLSIVSSLDHFGALDYLEIEKIVERKLGKPIHTQNGENDFSNHQNTLIYDKTWVTDTYTFSLMLTQTEYGYVFVIIVQGREPDFRQGYWGDSMGEIKKKEGEPDKYGMKNIYMFDTYVAGLSCMAGYRFTNGILTSGKYIFTDINSGNCIQHYEELVELLTMKYGEPGYNNKESSASEIEKSTYTEGELVIANKIRLQTEWLTPTSHIIIILYGEEYQPKLVIEYYSKSHQEERAADILKDL